MLTKKLLDYRTSRFKKRNRTIRTSIGYDKAHHVGVVFTTDDKEKHKEIKRFVKQLIADGKKVDVVTFRPKGKENYDFIYDFFTTEDISFWGSITSPIVSDFAAKTFDYVFYIDQQSTGLLRHILAMSKAKCRVASFDQQNAPYCEMMIETAEKNNMQKLVDDMYHYTKQLS